MIGVAVIALVLIFVPAHHQSAGFVFTGTYNSTGFGFLPYVLLIGLLMAQYTYTGYDASAHMSEETHRAQVSAPRGMVWSIIISVIAGWVLLLAVTFAIQNYKAELNSATGVPPFQIFIDSVGAKLATLLEVVVIGAQFWCGMCSVTANSRMIYAFSRDGAVPGSNFWHRISPRTRTPTHSVWLAAAAAFVLGLPYLWSPTAYFAVTSIAVIGLYIAYVAPIYLRIRQGPAFQPGPWHLGRWGRPIGIIAVIWVLIITILFILPEVSPVTATTFNYAPLAVGVVLLYAWGYWMVSARKWFKGPKVQGSEEELLAIERELDRAAGAAEAA
ncbi:MAG: amino acid permease [Rhodospirillales bacterium]|nr:amino acid permease [Rhodospirillales bacterium]